MFCAFDSFGDYFQFQLVGQNNDQLHHVSGAAVGQHTANQGAVDLQGFDGEQAQYVQRRVSGSKIIEDGTDAELP